MADAASFIVRMVDQVTGPAKASAKALAGLQASIRAAGQAGQNMPGMPKGAGLSGFVVSGANKAGSAVGKVYDSITEKAFSAAKYAALGIGAAGAVAGGMLVKSTVEMANFEETSKIAFKALTGSASLGDQAWSTTLNLSQRLGMSIEDVAGSMKHLLAMQFKLPEADELVRMSADLQSVTGDAHSAERALVAITQIKAKGKVQQEELTGQLAEAGVSTSLVYAELMKSMNLKSPAEVMKAITAGKVDADTGIAAIKAAIRHKTHTTNAGDAGIAFNEQTFSGLMNQMKLAPQFLFVRLGEAVKGSMDKLRPVVKSITDAINNISGDQLAKFVENALGFMAKLVPLGIEFAKGFGEGFAEMNAAFGQLDPTQASLATAKEMGHAVADAFRLALDVMKKLMEAILWLDQHREVAAGIAGMLAIDRVAGAGAAAKGLYSVGKWGVGKMLGSGAAAAATTVAETGAFGSLLGGASGTAAAAGGGGLLAGVSAAVLGAGALAAAGVGAAAYSYANREEFAQKMLNWWGNDQQAAQRGLGAPTPTPTLNALQGATARATTNNVNFQSSVNIDGANHDPNEIARNVADQQRGMIDQWLQGQALESGATG